MPAAPTRLAALAERMPTAPLAAAGLIAGYAVAVSTDSRPLGGAVMGACGLGCIGVWAHRDGRRTAATLTATGLAAFAASHGLGLLIGAWPSVLLVWAAPAAACWRLSDAHRPPHAADAPGAGDLAPAAGHAAADASVNGSRAAAR